MKRISIAVFLLLLLNLTSSGQWYNKKYGASDINALTLEQLQESYRQSKNATFESLGLTVVGGLLLLLESYVPYQVNDDSPIVEQIIGSQGMHYIMLGIATVTTVAGLGAMIVYFGRTSSIRSTMSKNYPGMSQMKISPAIMFNNQTSAYVPGVSISFRF